MFLPEFISELEITRKELDQVLYDLECYSPNGSNDSLKVALLLLARKLVRLEKEVKMLKEKESSNV